MAEDPPTRSGHHRSSHHHHHRSSHHHRSHHHRSHHRHTEQRGETSGRRTSRHDSRNDTGPSKTIAKSRSRQTSKNGTGTTRKHESSKRSRHTSRRTHRTGTGSGSVSRSVFSKFSRRSRQGPSSSIGPGKLEPVVIVMIVILAMSAVALLGVGIWLLATRNGWPGGLNNTGSRFWTRFISYGTACLIVAILLIPVLLLVILSALARTGASARRRRLGLTFLVSFLVLILTLMSATALFFAANGPGFVESVTRTAWVNTVTDGSRFNDACDIQNRYKCEGWLDNSCLKCRPTQDGVYDTPYGTCTNAQKAICPRCWTFEAAGQRTAASAAELLLQPATSYAAAADARGAASARLVDALGKRLPRRVRRMLEGRVAQRTVVPGCQRYIVIRHRQFFIPMCVYTIFLTLTLVLVSWKACIDSSGRY